MLINFRPIEAYRRRLSRINRMKYPFKIFDCLKFENKIFNINLLLRLTNCVIIYEGKAWEHSIGGKGIKLE